jgi:hypothetical protein
MPPTVPERAYHVRPPRVHPDIYGRVGRFSCHISTARELMTLPAELFWNRNPTVIAGDDVHLDNDISLSIDLLPVSEGVEFA